MTDLYFKDGINYLNIRNSKNYKINHFNIVTFPGSAGFFLFGDTNIAWVFHKNRNGRYRETGGTD